MEIKRNTVIRTECGRAFDLSRAARYAYNASAPYGEHNFAIFKMSNSCYYIKGYNTGTPDTPFNAYVLISPNEALQHLKRAA